MDLDKILDRVQAGMEAVGHLADEMAALVTAYGELRQRVDTVIQACRAAEDGGPFQPRLVRQYLEEGVPAREVPPYIAETTDEHYVLEWLERNTTDPLAVQVIAGLWRNVEGA